YFIRWLQQTRTQRATNLISVITIDTVCVCVCVCVCVKMAVAAARRRSAVSQTGADERQELRIYRLRSDERGESTGTFREREGTERERKRGESTATFRKTESERGSEGEREGEKDKGRWRERERCGLERR